MYYSPNYRNPKKSSSVPFTPSGVYRANIVAVNDDLTVDLVIPRLTGNAKYSKILTLGFTNTPAYSVGDIVYVAFLEGNSDDFIVLGPARIPGAYTAAPLVVATTDDLIFSWPSTDISTQLSGGISLPHAATTTEIFFTLGTPGTTSTVVEVYVNGTLSAMVTIAANLAEYEYPWAIYLSEEDLVSMRVVTPGSNAANLIASVRYN